MYSITTASAWTRRQCHVSHVQTHHSSSCRLLTHHCTTIARPALGYRQGDRQLVWQIRHGMGCQPLHTRSELSMLHLRDQACCFRPPEQAAHVPEASPKADPAHPSSPAKAVWALHKLICVLRKERPHYSVAVAFATQLLQCLRSHFL